MLVEELRMTKSWKSAAAAGALSIGMFGAGAVFTASTHAQAMPSYRAPARSDRSVVRVRTRLEALIDQLQRDEHDYGGHRVAAVGEMEQARAQLDAAIAWDRAHGH